MMVLLFRVLQTWLILGVCRSLAQGDAFLFSLDPSHDQFLPDGDVGETALHNSASVLDWSPYEDTWTSLMPDNEQDLASELSLDPDSSLSWWNDPIDGIEVDDGSPHLFAGSDIDCVSYEEQSIAKIRRAELCPAPNILETPPGSIDKPKDEGLTGFPPPGSNPGRLPGPENDPTPRPWDPWAENSPVNSDFDFQFCPSGARGYRNYAVCDSGKPDDRLGPVGNWYDLWDCTRLCKIRLIFPGFISAGRLIPNSRISGFQLSNSSYEMVLRRLS
jgi:hypothetical protein